MSQSKNHKYCHTSAFFVIFCTTKKKVNPRHKWRVLDYLRRVATRIQMKPFDVWGLILARSIDHGELYSYSTVYDRFVIYMRRSIDHGELYSYSSVLYYMIGLSFSCNRSMISWFSACISYRMSTNKNLQAWYFPIGKFNVQISSSV